MFDFPSTPTVGDKYPVPAVAGKPVYTWDGEKWTTSTAAVGGKQPIYSDGSVPMTAALLLAGDPVTVDDAARKAYVDKRLALAGGQTITGGFAIAPYNQAAGSFTVNPLNGNYQYTTNSAAINITAPATDCAVDILVTNAAGAGTIGFVGFTAGPNIGDALTTTVGHKFIISIRRINATSTYVIKALQ